MRCRKRLQFVRQGLQVRALPEVTGYRLQVTEKSRWKKAVAVVAFAILGTVSLLLSNNAPTAQAATSDFLNFQMRLLTSSGAVVSDGNYHIEFKLYKAANSTGSSQGSCTGDANCLWTETRTTGNLVRVVNGYYSVQLGSVTALPSIDYNQQLWLGVRIGGSGGTASWESIELTSDGTATGNKLALAAVPYAFSAKQLQGTSGTITNSLLFATPSGSNKTITIPNETGTVCTTAAAGVCSLAGGYVQLQSTTPGTAQTGNLNITGTGIIGTVKSNTFDGSGGTVNFNSGIYSFNDQFQVNNGLTNANSVHVSTTLTGNSIAGINLQPTFNTNGAGQTQYGQRIAVTNSAASANTLYGQYISFTDGGSLANTTTGLYVDAATANANDTQYSAILQGGNVGIGTATPGYKLEVNPGTTNLGGISILGSADNSGISFNNTGTGALGSRLVATSGTSGWGQGKLVVARGSDNVALTTWDIATGNTAIGPSALPANGVLTIGTNTTAATGGIYFGTDTNLYRSAADTLATDDTFKAAAMNASHQLGNLTFFNNQISSGSDSIVINPSGIGPGQAGFTITPIASQVNGATLSFSAAGNPVQFAATGGDTNLGLTLAAKGTGSLLVKNTGNSTTAFQIQNAATTQLFNVDSSTTANLISNNGFEVDTSGWAAKGVSTVSRITSSTFSGLGAGQVATTAAANDGASFNFTLSATTQYTLSVYARLSTGSMTTFVLGRQDVSGTDIDCLTGKTLGTNWVRYSCTFTTGGTITSSNIYIKQSDATARNIYIDGVQLETGAFASPYNPGGKISLNGVLSGPVAFQDSVSIGSVQGVSDRSLLGAGTSVKSLLSLGQTITDFNVDSVRNIANYMLLNPSAAASAAVLGADNRIDIQSGNSQNFTNALYGSQNSIVLLGGTGTYSNVRGASNNVTQSTGTVTNGYGSYNNYTQQSGGTVTGAGSGAYNEYALQGGTAAFAQGSRNILFQTGNATISGTGYGALNEVFLSSGVTLPNTIYVGGKNVINNEASGTLNTAFGGEGKINNNAGGTITFGSALESAINNTGTGIITNARGLDITAATNTGGGSITNNYGIYQDYQTAGTNDYALYFAGASNPILTVTGEGVTTIQPSSDSTQGFQVADKLGNPIIKVSTATLDNLLVNGSFEGATNGWAATGGSTLTSDSTQFYTGAKSLKVATSATNPSGTSYTIPFKRNTDYVLSFYARLDSGSMSVFEFGRTINAVSTNCATGQTLDTTWRQFTCTFTAGGTTAAADLLYFRKTGVSTFNIFLDAVQLEFGTQASVYSDPGFSLTNLVTNPSFEDGNNNGWSVKGTSINHGTSDSYSKFGLLSHVFRTDTTANNGTQYRFPFAASTQYSLSLWMRRDTSTTSTINIGRADNGSDTDCLTGQTVDTTWRQYTCTFTTGGTIGTSSNFYIKQTDTVSDDLKVDGVTLVQASSGLSFAVDASQVQADNLNSNLILNGSNNGEIQPWKQSANSLPAGRTESATATANGYIYIIGGEGTSTVYYAKLNADGSTAAWQTGTALPLALDAPAAVTANGYLYVLGGINGTTYQNKVYYAKLNADGSVGSWQTNSNGLGTAVQRLAAVVNNGYIYVLGGQISTIASTSATYYAKLNADGSTGAFIATTVIPQDKNFHGSFVANGYVFVISGSSIGGPDSYSAPLNSDGSIGSWTGILSGCPPGSCSAFGNAVFANGYIYLFGGQDSGNNRINTVIYTKLIQGSVIGQWQSSQYKLPKGVNSHHMVAEANGYIYVIGGFDGSVTHDSVIYTPLPRTTIAGGLDLVGLNSQNLAQYGGGGNLTAGNTQIVGSLQVQGAASFAQSIAVNGNGTFNGDIAVLAQTNNTPHTFGSTCACLVNATAGTFGSETLRNGAFSSAVYNGKLYVSTKETDASAIYRYDGDRAFTKVTDAAGKIIAGDTANIDASVLTVYNGKLYAGTQTGSASGAGAVYAYDGTTWTLLLATRGTFGAETARDGVSAIQVANGRLFIYTQEPDGASIYAYEGSTTWTRYTGVGQVLAETADIDEGRLIAYGGELWAGTVTGASTARIYKYRGDTFVLVNTTPGTFASGTTGVDDITSMAVYENLLFVGTREANLANIYLYDGGYDVSPGSNVFTKTTSTSGRIDATNDATDVDSVPSMQVYNGRLYAGSETAGLVAIYEYTGKSTSTTNGWTIVNSTRGTFGAQTGLDSVDTLISFNGSLYVGTEDTASNNGSVYTYTKTSGNSYSLQFSSDGSNTGGISFVGGQQANGNANNTGSFLFTHGIASTAGAYDVAEDYPTRDESLKPGDLVSIDQSETGFVRRTSLKSDSSILGIYSEKPGLRLSQTDGENLNGAKPIPVALAGRVPVNVTDENGPIIPGDYLTSSSKPGYAMKATAAGPTIGKALESLNSSSGKVLAFVNVSYYVPTIELQGSYFMAMDYLLINEFAKIGRLEVAGNATFNGSIIVAGHIIGNSDTAGSVTVLAGRTSVTYNFNNPFENPPRVTISPNSDTESIRYWTVKTVNSFTIHLSSPPPVDLDFDYFIQGTQ
ncbi:carbohydrate binding domain-containing protein [Candidatus Saccharibacteria bacterium]|nr:carbohydrate binding domain-containing protein [Candidatus Saccharibacteria bacterium]